MNVYMSSLYMYLCDMCAAFSHVSIDQEIEWSAEYGYKY